VSFAKSMNMFLSMRHAKLSVKLSLGFAAALVFIALFAPWLAPQHFDLQDVNNSYSNPTLAHFMGTDGLGRDLLSRLIYGCRVSISIAMITAISSLFIGVIFGTISGYMGGWVDKIMMRVVDVLYTLPTLIVMILVMLIFGRDLGGIYVALTATGWLGSARLMRAQVLAWKERPFVEAARSLGIPPLRLITRHILPNCVAPLIVELSYQVPTNILSEAFLSFLGIGVRPPLPSWGVLAEEGWRALQVHPHMTLFPGLMIFFTMLAFNTIGDDLRDRLDPFLRQR
jgi:oligopeptide transport system permease protein